MKLLSFPFSLRRAVGCLGLVILFLALPLAHADTTYTIPLNGRWAKYELGVKIPTEPAWAHDAVVYALQIWNEAQEWFGQKYFPDGNMYRFLPSVSGQVAFTFLKAYNEYYSGFTQVRKDSSNMYVSAAVRVVLVYQDGDYIEPNLITTIATHELGHVLGLGHTQVQTDLMYVGPGWQDTRKNTPSTLDLYGIHMLASGRHPQSVTLPSGIPYATAEIAIPEFSSVLGLFVVLLVATCVVFRRGIRGRGLRLSR